MVSSSRLAFILLCCSACRGLRHRVSRLRRSLVVRAVSLTVIVKQTFEGVDSFVLLAIPLFILAGALMETGGIAVRWCAGAGAGGLDPRRLSMAVVVPSTSSPGSPGSTVADVSAIGSP
jgi:TRAP-type mannitol/chloroaromatic compound transport system permease large subunit